ncbi:head-tail connector protein [Roseivivax isoporae]|uniref:PhiE125 gp8 family phage protein n=1 Tax=Roseivivax isoporae LMG 25204 TaxID=1449351 RepID=X7F3F4_9RHOB|nr:hypothetical protein [Roseivivax isoporae]ETX26564.1 hypothetical protein RISW2_22005 [Roseivivax isoporae LMG 25204]
MFRPVRIEAPAELPVSLEECKQHAVVSFDDDDALMETFLAGATEYLDGFRGVLGRFMVTQTWQVARCNFARRMVLPVPDVSSVEVTFDDAEGTGQTVPAELVQIVPEARGTLVRLSSDFELPDLEDDNPAPVQLTFTAGFGAAAEVPMPLKIAIMRLARYYYDDRLGTGATMSWSDFDRQIAPWRWMSV